MYNKRIIILQQTNSAFAEKGKELCGMVKVVTEKQTAVTVFVTNADLATFGEWWILLYIDGQVYSHRLATLNNDVFTLSCATSQNVSCLLIKKQEDCHDVAEGYFGTNFCPSLRRNANRYITDDDATSYEQFVASTKNFYQGADVNQLKRTADSRYQSVSDYSAAFERYYATGGSANYYQSVQREIGKVFITFPPYYPLINKYPFSYFVRIDFPSSEKYFVLGILQQNGVVRYICYGLPAQTKDFDDKDFVFVENCPTGFWMLFQDADSGQIAVLNEMV